MLVELEFPVPFAGLRDVRERLLRPAIGFEHPSDVLRDPFLDDDGKRAILSSWASDACAVENWPTLRWLFGTPRPVPLTEVLQARKRLDEPETAPPRPKTQSQTKRGNDGPERHAR